MSLLALTIRDNGHAVAPGEHLNCLFVFNIVCIFKRIRVFLPHFGFSLIIKQRFTVEYYTIYSTSLHSRVPVD